MPRRRSMRPRAQFRAQRQRRRTPPPTPTPLSASIFLGKLVPGAGIEPTRPCGPGILSPVRLPVSPPRQDPITASTNHWIVDRIANAGVRCLRSSPRFGCRAMASQGRTRTCAGGSATRTPEYRTPSGTHQTIAAAGPPAPQMKPVAAVRCRSTDHNDLRGDAAREPAFSPSAKMSDIAASSCGETVCLRFDALDAGRVELPGDRDMAGDEHWASRACRGQKRYTCMVVPDGEKASRASEVPTTPLTHFRENHSKSNTSWPCASSSDSV
jgi:hypothetical protein